MGKIVRCKTCSKSVAIAAKACPQCGDDDPTLHDALWSASTPSSVIKLFGEIAILAFQASAGLVGLGVIVWIFSSGNKEIGFFSGFGLLILSTFIVSGVFVFHMWQAATERDSKVKSVVRLIENNIIPSGKNMSEYESSYWHKK